MNRKEFKELVCARVLTLDGATGTEMSKAGMPPGVCPELWALEHRDRFAAIQEAYFAAGSDIVYTCTFGANRLKLEEFGLSARAEELNRELAGISRAAAARTGGLVFGDLAPTGRLVEPFGDLPFETAVEIYTQQVRALLAGGADGFVIETMMDIQEARAALLAVRETCDLPALVSMTFGEDGRTLTGTDPVSALVTLQALGADAVGCNCSTGPASMLHFVKEMKPYATVPLLAKPNAGMPELVDGRTVFRMGPEEFASYAPEFVAAGANLLGGCCGTTPEHIRYSAAETRGLSPLPPRAAGVSAVSSARRTVFFGKGLPVAVIGERINPTGKKKLQAELREGKLNLVRQFAAEQASGGAALLDVNFGLSGIDERETMLRGVGLLSQLSDLPLCLDTTRPEVMEAALRLYPGRALVNSVSAERARLEKMLPVAAKYGAMFILLPLTDDGIPPTASGRREVAERILTEARAYGYGVADVVVDGLVMAVSADPGAAQETLATIDWAANDWGANTTIGASNVSFGLPDRKALNATFVAMAIARGLSLAIANPGDAELMRAKWAAEALFGRDAQLRNYVAKFADAAPAPAAAGKAQGPGEAVFACVVQGDGEGIAPAVKRALASGLAPQELVDAHLIPAINRVGEMFDRKEYFLPQLMMGADAMKRAFAILEPLLAAAGTSSAKATVTVATVKGDIHDIGKNLVALMLRNYGFNVVDLGKDVSARAIVDAAREHRAALVGLSALMTTTMVEMRGVIELAKAEGLAAKFMIGGAVVDQHYADEIGADGYAADAMAAVRLAQKLC